MQLFIHPFLLLIQQIVLILFNWYNTAMLDYYIKLKSSAFLSFFTFWYLFASVCRFHVQGKFLFYFADFIHIIMQQPCLTSIFLLFGFCSHQFVTSRSRGNFSGFVRMIHCQAYRDILFQTFRYLFVSVGHFHVQGNFFLTLRILFTSLCNSHAQGPFLLNFLVYSVCIKISEMYRFKVYWTYFRFHSFCFVIPLNYLLLHYMWINIMSSM